MKIPRPVALILVATLHLTAAEPTSPAPNDSLAPVIKADWLDLARELGDESEAGQNEAARLQAAAQRIRTEARVAAKSMRRVMVLAGWRDVLNRWHDLELEIVLLQSGGGTMWRHLIQRDDALTERFLDTIADRLPLETQPLKPDIAPTLDDLLHATAKRLARAKADAARNGQDPDAQAQALTKRLEAAHADLKWQFQFAGDATTTQLLIAWCRDTGNTWESLQEGDGP